MSPVSGNTYFFHYVVVLSDALGDAHLEATQHDCNKNETLFSKMDTDEGTNSDTYAPVLVPPIISKISQGFLPGAVLSRIA